MRRLRISAPVQLPLALPGPVPTDQIWGLLPETVRTTVVVLLARFIVRGVLLDDAEARS